MAKRDAADKYIAQAAARSFYRDGETPTTESVARWSETNLIYGREVVGISDARYARFVAAVRREVDAMIQEDADVAKVLGR